jgi:pimeloyl-ACP methyl ester carboxylesterase
MAKIWIGDESLYYSEAGTGSPLLLIHGTGAHAHVFDAALPLLAEQHRVIVYDRRGYGRSGSRAAPRQGYLKHQADDAAALLRGLNATPATVVGWSMGAVIGLCLASEYPECVSRLVVFEPPLHASKHMVASSLVPFVKAMVCSALGRKQAAIATFLRMSLARRDGSSGYDDLDAATRAHFLANADTMLHELKTGTGEELTPEKLRTLRCPVDAIIGSESSAVFGEATERLAELLPQMQVLRAAGADHLLVLSRPADFARLALQSGAAAVMKSDEGRPS